MVVESGCIAKNSRIYGTISIYIYIKRSSLCLSTDIKHHQRLVQSGNNIYLALNRYSYRKLVEINAI